LIRIAIALDIMLGMGLIVIGLVSPNVPLLMLGAFNIIAMIYVNWRASRNP
jgi:hypothetical protein